jgi:hypothetical protein
MRKFIGRIITGRPVTTAECGPIESKGILKATVSKKVTVMKPTRSGRKK